MFVYGCDVWENERVDTLNTCNSTKQGVYHLKFTHLGLGGLQLGDELLSVSLEGLDLIEDGREFNWCLGLSHFGIWLCGSLNSDSKNV